MQSQLHLQKNSSLVKRPFFQYVILHPLHWVPANIEDQANIKYIISNDLASMKIRDQHIIDKI